MVAFNLSVNIHLSDRQKFLMSLAERLGLDGAKAWQAFLGNGTSTGLLAQARYWLSPAGVAAAADVQKDRQVQCHPAESASQRAWFQVWRELQKKSDEWQPAKRLLEFYLASISGTGTVERFIGCLGSVKSDSRQTLHERTLEASMKLLQQDLQGRREERLCPKALLSKPAPTRTSGGAAVLHPATPYFLKCQKRYAEWFGERASAGRSLEVPGLSELGKNMVKAKKPRLSLSKSSSPRSEAMQLQRHGESCAAAIDAMKSGKALETVIGTTISHPDPSSKNMLADMAQEAWRMRKRRRAGEEPSSVAAGSADASASTPTAMGALLQSRPLPDQAAADGIDWTNAVQAVQAQAAVAEKRAAAQAKAHPKEPASFVDSKGGLMQVKADDKLSKADKILRPPPVPHCPVVMVGPGVDRSQTLPIPEDSRFTKFPLKADIVLVSSVTRCWDTAEALLARLEGAMLQDLAGKKVVFQGSMHKQQFIFWLTATFASTYPEHTRVLEDCSARSPVMKSASAKAYIKRLDVRMLRAGESSKQTLWPSRTYELVAVKHPSDKSKKTKEKGEEKVQQLDLHELLALCGRCYSS